MPAIGVALESKSDGQATKILISGGIPHPATLNENTSSLFVVILIKSILRFFNCIISFEVLTFV